MILDELFDGQIYPAENVVMKSFCFTDSMKRFKEELCI